MKALKTFVRNEDGATAIEYGLIAALIAIVIIAALTTAGQQLRTIFERIRDALTTAAA
ncbi:Flp family type IVb pilin [Candidatus Nucleicultrix amoebiphila]|jgi:pilus assembly protein Flp/PilA|uniref:Flp family type IVb pilin n=1 Tax=Candidatus Nucleicultrix amoebiphila TaxID=1509244 RepID=UPI000A26B641|nr:Flp family type IVb pilin [Candidatus Nucleicultrix amoebiphila]